MSDAIRKAIKMISKDDKNVFSVVATVDEVDLTKKTCLCLPIDESKADLMNVKLMADNKTGFLLIPKVGSIVIVSFISNELYYISMFSELDEMLLNGDNYDGLVKVQELTDKLNNLEDALNQHILAYNLHTHAGVTVGSGATGITTPDTQILIPTIQTELENITVKHGNG